MGSSSTVTLLIGLVSRPGNTEGWTMMTETENKVCLMVDVARVPEQAERADAGTAVFNPQGLAWQLKVCTVERKHRDTIRRAAEMMRPGRKPEQCVVDAIFDLELGGVVPQGTMRKVQREIDGYRDGGYVVCPSDPEDAYSSDEAKGKGKDATAKGGKKNSQ
ncbi:hypothetical protein BJY01DRAFT_246434 [Aspergillus pseudoustus]|uniref:Uncharacterized protein n=1 Tax=Aspergillus pseudoustus TaxID=1810923 RepID=A0ABR4K7Z5_9EURO